MSTPKIPKGWLRLRPTQLLSFGDKRWCPHFRHWIACGDKHMARFSNKYRRIGNDRIWVRRRQSKPASGGGRKVANEIIKDARVNRRYFKKLKNMGASNYEICKALNISEDHMIFQQSP